MAARWQSWLADWNLGASDVADLRARAAPRVLAARWFVLRNVHRAPHLSLLQSRTTLCWLRGPMTRGDLRRLSRG